MIKFFRKIRQKLLTENKFSKYLLYAIGEIFLVVIGILIALQINNWNERQKNIISRNELLNAVHKECIINKEKLNFIKEQLTKSFNNVDELMGMFPINIKTVNLDTLRVKIRGSFSDWTFEPLSARINFLLNSSAFNLIDN